MRFKVKADTPETFRKVKELVAGNTTIYVISEKRLSLSTGPLHPVVRSQLVSFGAKVVPDGQYNADAA